LLSSAAFSTTAETYDEWAIQLPLASNAPTDDSDGDGLLNLVEYSLGLNPLSGGDVGLPTVTANSGTVTYSFTRPKSVVGVAYFVRVSSVVTDFTQLLDLSKLSETATTETWGATISGGSTTEFVWTSLVKLTAPTLTGHAGSSRPSEYDATLPYEIQAAFNNDTFFWNLRYPGNEGKRHDYWRFTNGAWSKEGGDRRDGQSSLDGDAVQGAINQNSTIYEQRTSIMISDPTAISHVTNFDDFACFVSCHNQSRHMPEWTEAAGEDTKYVDLSLISDGAANSDKVLDFWHWRGARSNPIGRADDQYIQAKLFVNSTSGDDGGRHGDGGTGVFGGNSLVDGHPAFVFNPSTTGGKFAFNWEDFWATPLYYIVQTNAMDLGLTAPNPVVLSWAEAVAAGYTPAEGDTVPKRILRAGAGSRADITSFGTQFVPTTADTVLGQDVMGTWDVQMQRALVTGNDDDVQMVAGNTYHAGFEVHLWEYTTRNHYVSFPQSITLGTGGDIEAVDLRGAGADGSGTLPDWTDTTKFPVRKINLFQPGIATWEFLTGNNVGKVYLDPATGLNVSQMHPGAGSVNAGTACVSCHNVKTTEPAPPLFNAGAMENLAGRRGGVWASTPVLQP